MGLKLKLVPYQNVPILQLMMFTTTPQRTTVIMDTTGMVSLIKMEIMDRPHTMVITGIVEIITKRKAQEIEETENGDVEEHVKMVEEIDVQKKKKRNGNHGRVANVIALMKL